MESAQKKTEILSEIIKNRRAIFPSQYTGERVDDGVINKLLENANWAPTHKKTEPWRFYVISNEKLKDLSDFASDWYLRHTPKDAFSQLKFEKTKTKALRCSHVIAICMKRDPENRVPEWEEMAAVSCAVQNMWLTCSAMGLGAYWSTPAAASDAGEFLGLEEGEKCLGWFYIGIPIKNIPLSGQRNSYANKVKWL